MRRIAATLAMLIASITFVVASISFAAVAGARPATRHRARAAVSSSQPDQVIQWNRTLLGVLQTPGAQASTVHPTRSMAIVHLAIYDAVNAIVGGNAAYLPLHAPRSASPDAAAAAAAHTVMLSLFPSQRSVIDAKFQDSLSQIGGGQHVRRGIRIGGEAANRILAARANDGSGATPPVF